MKDCHVHTNLSHDGISTFKEYIETSKEKNVDEINVKKVENVYNFSTKLLTPFALIQMFFWKILRIIAITLITFYKF